MAMVMSDGRRIGPKVFADVPSAAEVSAVRRSRNWLAILLILVIGALAVSVLGILYFANQAQAVPQMEIEHQRIIAEKDSEIAALQQELNRYGEFSNVVRLRTQADEHRTAIANELRRKPGAIVETRNSFFARDRRWPALMDDMQRGLNGEIEGEARVRGLAETRRRVEAWRAAPMAQLPSEP
jgi:hypothetical protein